jgi:hypothetical protein
MRLVLTIEIESRQAIAAILQAGLQHTTYDYTLLDCGCYRPAPLNREQAAARTTRPAEPIFDVKTVSDLGHNAALRPRLVTDDYWKAPSGEGPQAATWKDKPHRLVYDLVGEVERLRGLLLPAT